MTKCYVWKSLQYVAPADEENREAIFEFFLEVLRLNVTLTEHMSTTTASLAHCREHCGRVLTIPTTAGTTVQVTSINMADTLSREDLCKLEEKLQTQDRKGKLRELDMDKTSRITGQ